MADDVQPAAERFLDQNEVNTLLTPSQEAEPKGGVIAKPAPGVAGRKVAPFDFRSPAFLSELELRRLRSLQEDFVRYASARLSLSLRMEFGLKLAELTTLTYSKFTDSLPNPTHLSLFKLDALAGVGILDLHPRLALTIADRLLGGRGQGVKAERYLTEIEIALVEDVILILLEEWCGQWKAEPALRPTIVGHENNARFLQTSSRDALMLALTLECSFGDCCEQLRIAVPYYTIEPVVKRMQARRQKDAGASAVPRRAEWQSAYDRIAVPLRAEWEAFELSLREVTCLRVGDVLEMSPALCAETRVLLNGTPKFIGTVGLDADRVAVQLTRKLTSEDSSHGKPDGRKVS